MSRYGEEVLEGALRPSLGGQGDKEDPAEDTENRKIAFLKREHCSRSQMKKRLQGRITAPICQVLQMTTAVCNVKDINDLDKNASGGGAETEV